MKSVHWDEAVVVPRRAGATVRQTKVGTRVAVGVSSMLTADAFSRVPDEVKGQMKRSVLRGAPASVTLPSFGVYARSVLYDVNVPYWESAPSRKRVPIVLLMRDSHVMYGMYECVERVGGLVLCRIGDAIVEELLTSAAALLGEGALSTGRVEYRPACPLDAPEGRERLFPSGLSLDDVHVGRGADEESSGGRGEERV